MIHIVNIKDHYFSNLCAISLIIILTFMFINQSNCARVLTHINQQNFAIYFHVSFEEQKQLLVTPTIPKNVNFKFTTPYESYFILFYNSEIYESMETRQLYHDFYNQYYVKLIDLLKKRGARDFADYEYGVANSVQIAEIDCLESQNICNFFNMTIFPTFLYFTGGNQDEDMSIIEREVYVYTSWISIQEMLYFTMKAYSHKMIDLSRIKPITLRPPNPQALRYRQIKALWAKKQIKWIFVSGGIVISILAILILKMTMKQKKEKYNAIKVQNLKQTQKQNKPDIADKQGEQLEDESSSLKKKQKKH